MRHYFAKLSLITKVLLAPTVISAALLLVVLIAITALNYQKGVIDKLYHVRVMHYQKTAHIFNRLLSVNESLYRLISWQSYNYPAERIVKYSKEQKKVLSEQVTNLQLLANSPDLNAREKALAGAALSNVVQYAATASLVVDMVMVDPGMSTMTLTSADKVFDQIRQDLQELEKYENELGRKDFNAIALNLAFAMFLFLLFLGISAAIVVILVGTTARWLKGLSTEFSRVTNGLKTGDFNVRLTITSNDEIGKLASSFNDILERLSASLYKLQTMSKSIGQGSGELESRASGLSISSETQAASESKMFKTLEDVLKALEVNSNQIDLQYELIGSTAASISTMDSEMRDILKNAGDVTGNISENVKLALKSRDQIDRFIKQSLGIHESMEAVAKTIRKVGEYSDKIDQILKVIREISEQTNMLAMNASIEAVHAGGAGKGFAIVAGEVRKLSENTNKSIREISEVVKAIQNGLSEATQTVEEGSSNSQVIVNQSKDTLKSVEEIITAVETVRDMTQTISKKTEEQGKSVNLVLQNAEKLKSFSVEIRQSVKQQAIGADDIIKALKEASRVVEKNTEAAEELNALAGRLREDSDSLNGIVQTFEIK